MVYPTEIRGTEIEALMGSADSAGKYAVVGVSDAAVPTGRIEVDEYVPLRFDYGGDPLRTDLRFGNLRTSLLELELESDSLAVRGLKLVLVETAHDPKTRPELPTIIGRPVVGSLDERDIKGPDYARRVDVVQPFSVGLGADFLEIDLGRLAESDRIAKCGPVEFYLAGELLAGLRVYELTPADISVLRTYEPFQNYS